MNKNLLCIVVALGVAIASIGGCGSSGQPKSSLKGVVFYKEKGKPLPGGFVKLKFPDGGIVSADIDPESGAFFIANAPVGTAKVAITTKGVAKRAKEAVPLGSEDKSKWTKEDKQRYQELLANLSEDQKRWMKAKEVPIAAKYEDFETSGLTWEVIAGSNPLKEFVVDVK